MSSRGKGNLSENYGFDNHPPLWKGGLYLPFPIFSIPGGNMRDVSKIAGMIFDLGQIWQLMMVPLGPVNENNITTVTHSAAILRDFANNAINKKELPDLSAMCEYVASYLEGWIIAPTPTLIEYEQNKITRDIDHLRTILYSELGKLYIQVIEEIGGHSVKTLWKNPLTLLKGVGKHLLIFVKSNFAEAAKCLVLNSYTAVGFHCVRSIEHVARKYFELIIGKTPLRSDGKYMPLASIAQELLDRNNKLKKDDKSNDLVIIASLLKAINKESRDPLAHPEIIRLQENEAIGIFYDARQVITKVIEDAKEGGAHFTTLWKRGYLF